jgi:membrane protein implicated in regulation of membrane protease activity
LASESPAFVAGFLGMFSGAPSQVDLGVLPTIWNISGPMFILGPTLFGIATFRAGVLPRWAGALLALNIVLVPLGAILPPEYQPTIMIPVGLALAWLGYALASERREKVAEALREQRNARPEPSQVA